MNGFPDMNLERTESRLFKAGNERLVGTLKKTWQTVIGHLVCQRCRSVLGVGKIVDDSHGTVTSVPVCVLTHPTAERDRLGDQPAIVDELRVSSSMCLRHSGPN